MIGERRKKVIIGALLLSFTLIIMGVTMAIFNFFQTGTKDNVVTTGEIVFHYTEINQQGTGISITDAIPISDELGKEQKQAGKYFDFSIESKTMANTKIPYTVSARLSSDSTLDPSIVKVYLTEVNGDTESEILLENFSELESIDGDNKQKIIYKDTVPVSQSNYYKKFRFRMWIDEEADFSGVEQADGTIIYPYNDKIFKINIDVNANGKVIAKPVETKIRIFSKTYDVVQAEPTLTTSSNNTEDAAGVYASTDTDTEDPTYYFRGNVNDNYVKFAGFTWRIVRLNEDGTVRLVMQDGINDNTMYSFYDATDVENGKYFTNSNAKKTLEAWYNDYLSNYDSYILNGNYCEKQIMDADGYSVIYEGYNPTYTCKTDDNGHGLLTSKIGILSYDEIAYAGGHINESSQNHYLVNNNAYWLMTPIKNHQSSSIIIVSNSSMWANSLESVNSIGIRPVINVKNDEKVLGQGTEGEPFVIGTDPVYTTETINIFGQEYTASNKLPYLTKASSSDTTGLYKSLKTETGNPVYYFRGDIQNNYVKLNNMTWRIMRVNEDGTIRLISQERVGSSYSYKYSDTLTGINDVYYSNSNIKTALEDWYDDNLASYDFIVDGSYCEAAKVKLYSWYGKDMNVGNAKMDTFPHYQPSFTCETDGNGHGKITAKIGLMTYDDAVYSGITHSYYGSSNSYLKSLSGYAWTMSPGTTYGMNNGVDIVNAIWYITPYDLTTIPATSTNGLMPVINVDPSKVTVTGIGTSDQPFELN